MASRLLNPKNWCYYCGDPVDVTETWCNGCSSNREKQEGERITQEVGSFVEDNPPKWEPTVIGGSNG